MLRLNLLVCAAIALSIAGAPGCDVTESREYSFVSWEKAVASGEIGPGKWIPADLPILATDIQVRHAIDSEHTLIAFRLPSAALSRVPPRCQPTTSDSVELTKRPSKWWPEELTGPGHPNAKLAYYVCGRNQYYALADEHGYFWKL